MEQHWKVRPPVWPAMVQDLTLPTKMLSTFPFEFVLLLRTRHRNRPMDCPSCPRPNQNLRALSELCPRRESAVLLVFWAVLAPPLPKLVRLHPIHPPPEQEFPIRLVWVAAPPNCYRLSEPVWLEFPIHLVWVGCPIRCRPIRFLLWPAAVPVWQVFPTHPRRKPVVGDPNRCLRCYPTHLWAELLAVLRSEARPIRPQGFPTRNLQEHSNCL